MSNNNTDPAASSHEPRRDFLSSMSAALMAGGLTLGYGMFASHAGRFLFPAGRGTFWQYVATVDSIRMGDSLSYETPTGAKVVVARKTAGNSAEDFVALSSVCPHLGCAVHWEQQNERFFCPCHNGAFDAAGKATEGPPAAAKQELTQFPLKVENGLLYVEVSADSIGGSQEA